jgi:hypothetical protein
MLLRAIAVWAVLVVVESIHGSLRRLVLEPWIGDFAARQVSVFIGSLLIVVAAILFIDWIAPRSRRQLTSIGMMWVLLTLAFEVGAGRFLLYYSWQRILSDFNLLEGGLLGFGLVVMGFAPRIAASFSRVKAARAERVRDLPGDDLIPRPIGSMTHAITIRCSRQNLWPWLAQMGAGRAGWYSYDLFDNGGRRSAERILPEFQNASTGTLFPALPDATDAFVALVCEPARFLILGVPRPEGEPAVTWTFALEDADTSETRLIVRVRVNRGDGRRVPLWFMRFIHYVMQRKQLLEIARRAEMADVISEMAA